MKILSNAHTHTLWCDGESAPADIAQAAVKLGFSDVGFSSHAPSPRDPVGVGIQDEAGYRTDVASVKKNYSGQLGILCGIEMDYFDQPEDPAGYDYRIGSLHYLPSQEDGALRSIDISASLTRRIIDEEYGGEGARAARYFYELSATNVRKNRPEIVGHYDIIAKYNRGNLLFDEASPTYRRAALECLDEILALTRTYGGIIEMNMSPLVRKFRDEPYPALFLLRHMAQQNARVLVTSDSHSADTLNAGFDIAPVILQQAGFSSMALLQGGTFIDVKLEPYVR